MICMTRAKSRRGIAEAYLAVIARSTCDEAIQLSFSLRQSWNCFVAFRLRSLSFGGRVAPRNDGDRPVIAPLHQVQPSAGADGSRREKFDWSQLQI
jgi:hypothetical protein